MIEFIPEDVIACLSTIEDNGYQAYLVGGAVRDALLGIKTTDFDIATSALPETIEKMFPKTISTGMKFGTITVVLTESIVEITTFRHETTYDNHRKPVAITYGVDFKEDLKRRDFTVNAIALTHKGEMIDIMNGGNDLKLHLIKTIGNPEERFFEDALRILRMIRFSAKLNFKIEEKTLQAGLQLSPLLEKLSIERIRSELEKILLTDYPEKLDILIKSGGLAFLGFDKYESLAILKKLPKIFSVRFSAFIYLCSTDDSPVKKVLIDKKSKNEVSFFYKNLKNTIPKSKKELKIKLKNSKIDDWKYLCQLLQIIKGEDASKIRNYLKQIIKFNEPYKISMLAINGDDIKNLGVCDGFLIGQALKSCLEYVIEFPEKNNIDDLSDFVKEK